MIPRLFRYGCWCSTEHRYMVLGFGKHRIRLRFWIRWCERHALSGGG